ncbi:MAG TPA: pyrimidine dimer DNA glycosylase/endonuclease V [Flavobacteriaceae bacterium]|nr:pyrimidine dimer DNA glycosylase/endonuclease V [Flavobacteriaceae bacterium]HEX5743363.1 pyrimidine dimer DNA glycosylase/endonuclease V [Flavobacteriaceae bacterium]
MRIWSLHPAYLDTKGLVALWRETLLAKNVLEGNTKGYKNHPQLIRFKNAENPIQLINQYLSVVFQESLKRGYHFNQDKFKIDFQPQKLTVTQGQLNFEMQHLLKKLKNRDPHKYQEVINEKNRIPHPIFEVIEGTIEVWEIV